MRLCICVCVCVCICTAATVVQTSLREGCNAILRSDCVDLSFRLVTGLRHGRAVERGESCHGCHQPVTLDARSYANARKRTTVSKRGVIVFMCAHMFHTRCLDGAAGRERVVCPVCTAADTSTKRKVKRKGKVR